MRSLEPQDGMSWCVLSALLYLVGAMAVCSYVAVWAVSMSFDLHFRSVGGAPLYERYPRAKDLAHATVWIPGTICGALALLRQSIRGVPELGLCTLVSTRGVHVCPR